MRAFKSISLSREACPRGRLASGPLLRIGGADLQYGLECPTLAEVRSAALQKGLVAVYASGNICWMLDFLFGLGRMLGLAPRLMRQLGVSNGFRTLINTGPDGGQEVYHLHMHVMGGPRPWSRA